MAFLYPNPAVNDDDDDDGVKGFNQSHFYS